MSKTKSVSSYRTSFSSSLPLFIHSPTLSFSEFLTLFKTWIIMSVILSSVHQVTSVRMVQFSMLYNQRQGKEYSRTRRRESRTWKRLETLHFNYRCQQCLSWSKQERMKLFLGIPFSPFSEFLNLVWKKISILTLLFSLQWHVSSSSAKWGGLHEGKRILLLLLTSWSEAN